MKRFNNRLKILIFIDLLIVIILGVGFISAYFMYQNIQSRDNIEFSKLNDTALIHPSKFENSFDILLPFASSSYNFL